MQRSVVAFDPVWIMFQCYMTCGLCRMCTETCSDTEVCTLAYIVIVTLDLN